MKASTAKSFGKKLACPSSHLLLSFSTQTLAPEINFLVKHHLAACDFCYCEIPLLTFYTAPLKSEACALRYFANDSAVSRSPVFAHCTSL